MPDRATAAGAQQKLQEVLPGLRSAMAAWERAERPAGAFGVVPRLDDLRELLAWLEAVAVGRPEEMAESGEVLVYLARHVAPLIEEPAAGALRELARRIPASLPSAEAEVQSIVELLPAGAGRAFYCQAATRDALLGALGEVDTAHLSCHGIFEAADPLASRLCLADGELTLRELLSGRIDGLQNIRLAVLSACQTAIQDFGQLPDEAIGLPASAAWFTTAWTGTGRYAGGRSS